MQVTECKSNSERIKLGSFLAKLSCFPEMHEKLSTPDKLHNEENLLIGLKYVLHAHEEWVISFEQNIFFKECALNLIIVQNDILS